MQSHYKASSPSNRMLASPKTQYSVRSNFRSLTTLDPRPSLPTPVPLLASRTSANLGKETRNRLAKLTPLCATPRQLQAPKLHSSVVATASCGVIKSYAANSHVGLVRQTNEDRVMINYRVSKPDYKLTDNWPTISYFGIFDGHGGSSCAEFLRDNLLDCILKQEDFPHRPVEAIKAGFADAEEQFLEQIDDSGKPDYSGSCANVVLVIKDICYVANVGDSRAIMSADRGMRLFELSQDHKPNLPKERDRIEKCGGKVYTTEALPSVTSPSEKPQVTYRVLPGRLAISRAFGDADAKLMRLGGSPGAVSAVPDVKTFRISKKYDFILIASDGVYDCLSNSDIVKTAWNVFNTSQFTFHGACGEIVKSVLEEAMSRRSYDNVTAVLISFGSMRTAFEEGANLPR